MTDKAHRTTIERTLFHVYVYSYAYTSARLLSRFFRDSDLRYRANKSRLQRRVFFLSPLLGWTGQWPYGSRTTRTTAHFGPGDINFANWRASDVEIQFRAIARVIRVYQDVKWIRADITERGRLNIPESSIGCSLLRNDLLRVIVLVPSFSRTRSSIESFLFYIEN